MAKNKTAALVHPGLVVAEYFGEDANLNNMTKILGCSHSYLVQFLAANPDYTLTKSMCFHLSHYLDTTYQYWMDMQEQYDELILTQHENMFIKKLANNYFDNKK